MNAVKRHGNDVEKFGELTKSLHLCFSAAAYCILNVSVVPSYVSEDYKVALRPQSRNQKHSGEYCSHGTCRY